MARELLRVILPGGKRVEYAYDTVCLAGDTRFYGYCLADPINLIDPLGLLMYEDVLYYGANFAAGMGDYISGGWTKTFREWQMGEDIVDVGSGCPGSAGIGHSPIFLSHYGES